MIRIPSANEIRPVLPTEGSTGAKPAALPAGEASFGGVLAKMVDEANTADRTASAKVDALAAGASDDLHGTMISVKEAEISMKLVGSVRNKLLDAFHEIWRTSV